MDANNVADMIVSSVKNSKLNFIIQESPFSLNINIRKSFLKDKNGCTVKPPIPTLENSDKVNESSEKQEVKVRKLELENSSLLYSLGKLQVELQEARDALHDQGIQLEKIKIEHENALHESNKICEQKERVQNELMAKNYEIIRLETKNKNLDEQLDIKNKESIYFIESRNEVIKKVHELDKKTYRKRK